MAFLLGNKLQGSFTSASSVTTVFAITGFSHSGGDRPEIDITTGSSTRRQVLAGLASPEEMTLSVKYEVQAAGDDPEIDPAVDVGVDLRAALEECASGTLLIKLNASSDCGTARIYLNNGSGLTANVDAVSWNFSTELDGIMEGEVTFRVRH
ncbi:MAG: hypothetical protein GY878_21470 [Fuerstiella sp.]|nr:hypothetical protein [Fuerstiella sp.]